MAHRYRKIPPAEREVIVKHYIAGRSLAWLQQETGHGFKSLRGVLVGAGVPIRPMGGRQKVIGTGLEQRILRLYPRLSQEEIARRLHIGQAVVGRVLRRHNKGSQRHRVGKNHWRWKGGRHLTEYGYVLVQMPNDHPFASAMQLANGYVPEHRLRMAERLGRPLTRREQVHHINGNRQDNRIDNLQLRIGNHGLGACYKCADCGSRNVVAIPLQEE